IAVSPSTSAYYSVTGTDTLGCSKKDSALISVSPCAGIAQLAPDSYNVRIYPNPAYNATVTLAFGVKTSGSFKVRLLDVYGRTIKEESGTAIPGDNILFIDLKEVAKGVYYILLENGAGPYKTKLINQ
ncbi:MAG: T9SS type A sorting domain-containing protein, partial [Bacteroidia bacterium]